MHFILKESKIQNLRSEATGEKDKPTRRLIQRSTNKERCLNSKWNQEDRWSGIIVDFLQTPIKRAGIRIEVIPENLC